MWLRGLSPYGSTTTNFVPLVVTSASAAMCPKVSVERSSSLRDEGDHEASNSSNACTVDSELVDLVSSDRDDINNFQDDGDSSQSRDDNDEQLHDIVDLSGHGDDHDVVSDENLEPLDETWFSSPIGVIHGREAQRVDSSIKSHGTVDLVVDGKKVHLQQLRFAGANLTVSSKSSVYTSAELQNEPPIMINYERNRHIFSCSMVLLYWLPEFIPLLFTQKSILGSVPIFARWLAPMASQAISYCVSI